MWCSSIIFERRQTFLQPISPPCSLQQNLIKCVPWRIIECLWLKIWHSKLDYSTLQVSLQRELSGELIGNINWIMLKKMMIIFLWIHNQIFKFVILLASGLELEPTCWQKVPVHGPFPCCLHPVPEGQGCYWVLQTAFPLPHRHGGTQRR